LPFLGHHIAPLLAARRLAVTCRSGLSSGRMLLLTSLMTQVYSMISGLLPVFLPVDRNVVRNGVFDFGMATSMLPVGVLMHEDQAVLLVVLLGVLRPLHLRCLCLPSFGLCYGVDGGNDLRRCLVQGLLASDRRLFGIVLRIVGINFEAAEKIS